LGGAGGKMQEAGGRMQEPEGKSRADQIKSGTELAGGNRRQAAAVNQKSTQRSQGLNQKGV